MPRLVVAVAVEEAEEGVGIACQLVAVGRTSAAPVAVAPEAVADVGTEFVAVAAAEALVAVAPDQSRAELGFRASRLRSPPR